MGRGAHPSGAPCMNKRARIFSVLAVLPWILAGLCLSEEQGGFEEEFRRMCRNPPAQGAWSEQERAWLKNNKEAIIALLLADVRGGKLSPGSVGEGFRELLCGIGLAFLADEAGAQKVLLEAFNNSWAQVQLLDRTAMEQEKALKAASPDNFASLPTIIDHYENYRYEMASFRNALVATARQYKILLPQDRVWAMLAEGGAATTCAVLYFLRFVDTDQAIKERLLREYKDQGEPRSKAYGHVAIRQWLDRPKSK